MNLLIFNQELMEKNFDSRVLNQYERFNFQRLIGISIGFSTFLGGILFLIITLGRLFFESVSISRNYIIFAFGLIFVGLWIIKDMGEGYTRALEKNQKEMIKWVRKN
jgi:hypothetical protein